MAPKRRKVALAESSESSKPAATPPFLARIPSELFDEILEYFTVPSLTFRESGPKPSSVHYFERTDALRALSQTCHALQTITRPMLWKALDTSRVPTHAEGTYYKYVMQEIIRKAEGVCESKDIPTFVQNFTFMITKSALDDALSSLISILTLPALSNLRVIKVISCNASGALSKALTGIVLPTVRTVIVPTNAHSVLRMCPNATDVYCLSGGGKELINALKFCKCESFEGYVNWNVPGLIDRLVKNAPVLRKLELCHAMNYYGDDYNDHTISWPSHLAKLSKLAHLSVIQLTFFGTSGFPAEDISIAAARDLLSKSSANQPKRLHIRRATFERAAYELQRELEVHSSIVETIT